MKINKLHELCPYTNFDDFMTKINYDHLSMDVIRQIINFKLSLTDANGFLLLKNNPIGSIPPTPTVRDELAKYDTISENSLIAVANILGDCIAYLQESSQQVINNFFPIKTLQSSHTSDSSDSELELHTENAFHLYSPDYLVLLCLRQDSNKEAITYVSSINHIKKHLSTQQIEYFFKTTYNFLSDYSENEKNVKVDLAKHLSILYGSRENMLFRFDPDFMHADDPQAVKELGVLKQIALKCALPVCLAAGDILIIDNQRTAHARSKFSAYYNGKDRWLQRVFVSKNREKIIADTGLEHRILSLR